MAVERVTKRKQRRRIGKHRVRRALVLVAAFLLALIIGLAYPALRRGDELLGARWEYPWMLLFLVLVPFVFWRATLGEDRRTPRLRVGTIAPLARGPSGWRVLLRDVPGSLRAVGLGLLILALGRPINTLRPQTTQEEGIDIVVAMDLSGSMRAAMGELPQNLREYLPQRPRGVKPTRIDVARAVLRDFISRRKHDRIGVVVFAVDAYVLSPPTLDYQLLDALVSRMEIEVIDPGATAIGDAVGVAVARLRRSHAKSKAVILVTDGDNKGGRISPEYAAHLASSLGVKVFTIQIGQGEVAEVQDGFDLFGQPRYVTFPAPTNPELLRELASQTGGEMYVATDPEALEASFHSVLNALEKTKLEANIARYEELFALLLLPGAVLIALEALLRSLVLRRFP